MSSKKNRDPYRRVAGLYERLFESINKGLRILGVRLYIPPKGGSILDVGCGTGVHLETYSRFECKLSGIDASPSMLEVARERLGTKAELLHGDASDMPYPDNSFDLILCMLVLHEMDDEIRSNVLDEMKRLIKKDGRVLLIDYHAGRPGKLKGWSSRLLIVLAEMAAGRRHFRSFRHFMSMGGLPALIERGQFEIDKERIVGNNTLALYLLRNG